MTNSRTVAGMELFKELLTLICHKPDMLEVDFSLFPHLRILAHPNDAKIIVGRGGRTLNALATVARYLISDSINIMPVESHPGRLLKDVPFVLKKKWPEQKITALLGQLTKQVFGPVKVTIRSEEATHLSQAILIVIEPTPDERDLNSFGVAIATLFVPIGASVGRLIYVNIK